MEVDEVVKVDCQAYTIRDDTGLLCYACGGCPCLKCRTIATLVLAAGEIPGCEVCWDTGKLSLPPGELLA